MKLTIFCDGACWPNPGPTVGAAVAVREDGLVVAETSKSFGPGTNNTAEYQALILGAKLARFCDASQVNFLLDSMLVVQQVLNYWAIKDPELGKLHAKATALIMQTPKWTIAHIPRSRNERADWLCNQILRPADKRATKPAPEVFFQEPRTLSPGWANLPAPQPRTTTSPGEDSEALTGLV